MEKWPVKIEVRSLTESLLGDELRLYFVTGTMNKEQRDTLLQQLPKTTVTFEGSDDVVVVSSVLTHSQLSAMRDVFKPLAKEWRGQYYAVTNAFMAATEGVL